MGTAATVGHVVAVAIGVEGSSGVFLHLLQLYRREREENTSVISERVMFKT